jgi:DNA-directed RNA polymerase specialized sigma24 family protein
MDGLDGGEMNVLQLEKHRACAHEKSLCATAEDFEQVFAKENTDLLRLSLQLTADAAKAENCLMLAMRDCLFMGNVARDRVPMWARRMVMRNAIRQVWGYGNDILGESGYEFYLQPSEFSPAVLRESVAILSLPDLERVAFVMCVLERYSILDCALVLSRTPQEVYEALVRAISNALSLEESWQQEAAAAIPQHIYDGFWDERSKVEGSCGSILE